MSDRQKYLSVGFIPVGQRFLPDTCDKKLLFFKIRTNFCFLLKMSSTIEWLIRIFGLCNDDPSLEFEVKFCDQFQGFVSEQPHDFRVGINASRFYQLKERFSDW